MTDQLQRPEYRARLFLSVDLTGSTQFKSKDGTTNLKWLKPFQKFYGEFPAVFTKIYREICETRPDIVDFEKSQKPKVWKTIGDEILFVNRVHSLAQLGAYVSAFSDALKEFGSEIKTWDDKLDTKGNGWIASFPHPNCSIQVSHNGDGDPVYGNNDVLTEDFELLVDEDPQNYDFLGKGIDGGFRISRNSTIDTFTVSPALAYLLCRTRRNFDTTGFTCKFQFHEPQVFKGVVDGAPYPIVSIDTSRDKENQKMLELQSELLKQPNQADLDTLTTYLECYIGFHKIEMPALKISYGSTEVDVPEHYTDYMKQWEVEVSKITTQDAGLISASEQSDEEQESTSEDASDLLELVLANLTNEINKDTNSSEDE